MSAGFSSDVRCTRKVRERRGEENQAESLEDEEHRTDPGSQEAGPTTGRDPAAVRGRCSRAAAVTLAVMYLLILAGAIVRYISVTLENDQLQRMYDNLRNNHSRLQDKVKLLQENMSGMCCPEGWRRFGCSCYYKVSERKKWEESRTDCQSREADLVVINSREEQEFVRELNTPGVSWIGLKAEYRHKSTGWEPKWEWVDGSPLTVMFWETGNSQKIWHQYAECCNKQGRWTQSRQYNSNNWICEKTLSCSFC